MSNPSDSLHEALVRAADHSSPCARVLRYHEGRQVATRSRDFYVALKRVDPLVVRLNNDQPAESLLPLDCRFQNGAVEFTHEHRETGIAGRDEFIDDVQEADSVTLIPHRESQFTDGDGDEREHVYAVTFPSGRREWTPDYAVAFEHATGCSLDAIDLSEYEGQAEDQTSILHKRDRDYVLEAEARISILHTRGREYVLDLSTDADVIENQEVCLNRQYDCGHAAYGPPRRLPSTCPECKPVATDGGRSTADAIFDAIDQHAADGGAPAGRVLDTVLDDTDHDLGSVCAVLRELHHTGQIYRPNATDIKPTNIATSDDEDGGRDA